MTRRYRIQCPPSPSISAGEIERFVIDEIRSIGTDNALAREVFARTQQSRHQRLDQLDRESQSLREFLRLQHSELEQLARQSGLPSQTDLIAAEQSRITRSKSRLIEIDEECKRIRTTESSLSDVRSVLGQFDDLWESMPIRDRERLIELPLVAVGRAPLIEDLNCDSLDMIELIMETEDEFGITIPDTPKTPVGKLIFTRTPFRMRDLAGFAFLNRGTGSPVRSGWRKRNVTMPQQPERAFSQLGGRWSCDLGANGKQLDPLDSDHPYRMFRRTIDGMVSIEIPATEVVVGSDDPTANDDEKPRHSVSLSSYLIDIEQVAVNDLYVGHRLFLPRTEGGEAAILVQ